jgi:hypothetical protein
VPHRIEWNLSSESPSIIRMIKSRRMRLVGHVALDEINLA